LSRPASLDKTVPNFGAEGSFYYKKRTIPQTV